MTLTDGMELEISLLLAFLPSCASEAPNRVDMRWKICHHSTLREGLCLPDLCKSNLVEISMSCFIREAIRIFQHHSARQISGHTPSLI